MSWLAWENEKDDPEPVGTNHRRKAIKSKNKAMSVAKGAGCVVLLFTSLFPLRPEEALDLLGAAGSCAASRSIHDPSVYYVQ